MIDYLGWRDAAELLLLPPANLIVLMIAAAFVWPRRPGAAAAMWGIAVAFLYLFSLPVFANSAISLLEPPPLDPASYQGRSDAAIVVLSADLARDQPEYGGDTVGGMTLERLRYAAFLQRRTGLPILVSGGVLRPDAVPIALLMQRTLEEEFRVPVRWVETHSRTTFENAVDSAAILIPAGIRTALVVTHAWHVPRALESFKATALAAVGAPTAYTQPPGEVQLRDFLPRPSALLTTYFAAHEWVGRAWYLVLGRLAAPA